MALPVPRLRLRCKPASKRASDYEDRQRAPLRGGTFRATLRPRASSESSPHEPADDPLDRHRVKRLATSRPNKLLVGDVIGGTLDLDDLLLAEAARRAGDRVRVPPKYGPQAGTVIDRVEPRTRGATVGPSAERAWPASLHPRGGRPRLLRHPPRPRARSGLATRFYNQGEISRNRRAMSADFTLTRPSGSAGPRHRKYLRSQHECRKSHKSLEVHAIWHNFC